MILLDSLVVPIPSRLAAGRNAVVRLEGTELSAAFFTPARPVTRPAVASMPCLIGTLRMAA